MDILETIGGFTLEHYRAETIIGLIFVVVVIVAQFAINSAMQADIDNLWSRMEEMEKKEEK